MRPKLTSLATVLSIVLSSPAALGQATAVTYQGRLNISGLPATGIFDLRFALYGAASGGTAIAGAVTNTLGVTNGLFTATIYVDSSAFDGTDRWLEVGVRVIGTTNGFTLLAPRQPITATPYAVRAANYSGPVAAAQVSGALPASQLSGTLIDAQLSTNVALVSANQTFSGANTFANPANTFLGGGAGLTGLNAANLASGTIPDKRLSEIIARLDRPQILHGNEGTGAGLRIEGLGTNNWLLLSNGAIWLPPFTFPSEDGGDAQRGGIYFASTGDTGPNVYNYNNHYILNIINRGAYGGQLLISHQSIYFEEQTLGQIVLGNDGSSGGLVEIRYDDSMGNNLYTNIPGHAHVVFFSPRVKLGDGSIHNSNPGIIAFHGGGPDEFPGDPNRGWGPNGRGEIAFYTSTAWPGFSSELKGGLEMGRMETNGWNFRGTMTYQKAAATITSGTNYTLDFGTNNYLELTLSTSPVSLRTINPHADTNSVQTLTLILHAGAATRSVTFPPWKVLSPTGSAVLPTLLAASTTTVVRLEVLDGGGDTKTLARFETYLGP